MAYESTREKEIAKIISEELNDSRIAWAAIDAAAKRIARSEKDTRRVNASDVDPTAGLNPDFNWGGND